MKNALKTLTCIAAGLALSLPAAAMDHSKMDHGAKAEAAGGKSPMKGAEIRNAKSDGYGFRYELIDVGAMMKGMNMPSHDMSKMKSHHLMVYIAGPDGKPLTQGKIGYLVTGPDQAEQKLMAGAMSGGYGADMDLKAKGAYKVLTKAVFGDKTVKDEFTYTVK